jgi:hypothetical protein
LICLLFWCFKKCRVLSTIKSWHTLAFQMSVVSVWSNVCLVKCSNDANSVTVVWGSKAKHIP